MGEGGIGAGTKGENEACVGLSEKEIGRGRGALVKCANRVESTNMSNTRNTRSAIPYFVKAHQS